MQGRPLIDVLFPEEPPVTESKNQPADLAARLRALLDDRGLTVAEVARDAGMHKQQLHAILTGQTVNPGILTIMRIVEAAGGTMAELFADEGGDG